MKYVRFVAVAALVASLGTNARGAGQRQAGRAEEGSRQGRRRDGEAGAGDGRLRLQLRRARHAGSRDLEVPDGAAREVRLQGHARAVGHADRLGGDLRLGQAGDRARLRHRRHSAVVAEAGRRLPRPDHRGRAGSRRGPQHRHAAQHHRGDRGEAHHGARQAARHDHAVAGRRRGTGRLEGVVRARRHVQGRRRQPVHARRRQPRHRLGPAGRHRAGLDRVHLRGRDGAQRRRAVARPLGARRRRADERRLELPPRAPAPVAALALDHHQRRRPAERRAAQRQHLVLLPRDRPAAHQGAGRDRQQDGRRRGADDQHQGHLAHSRHRVSAPHEQGGGRNDVGQHPGGRPADVERAGPGARQGAAEGTRQRDAERPGREARRAGQAGRRSKTTTAAAPTTSATSRGTCRPSR